MMDPITSLDQLPTFDIEENKVLEDNRLIDSIALDGGQNQFEKDISSLNYGQIASKYGKAAADQSVEIGQRRSELSSLEANNRRSASDILNDSLLDVTSSGVNIVGGGAAALAPTLINAITNNTGPDANSNIRGQIAGAVSASLNKATEGLSGFINEQTTEHLQNRRSNNSIRNSADSIRNRIDVEQNPSDINSFLSNVGLSKDTINDINQIGIDNDFINGLRVTGKDILSSGSNLLSDPVVATSSIAQAVGSLGPSAKLVSGATKIASKLTSGSPKIVQDITESLTAAVAVGASEASGTFQQTQSAVLSMSIQDLRAVSERFHELESEGLSPEQARTQLALSTANEAFAKQLPVASAIGLISSKFEGSPVDVFKGKSIGNIASEIAGQTIEEGLQGGTGQLNQNLAIQNQVDENIDITDGVGENIAVGAIAGTGLSAATSSPTVVSDAARNIGSAISKSPLADDVVNAASELGNKVSEGASSIKETVSNKVDDINNRTDKKTQNKTVQSAIKAEEISIDLVSDPDVETPQDVIKLSVSKDTTNVPDTFKDTVPEEGTLIQKVSGLVENFSKPDVNIDRLSDTDILYAADRVQQLSSLTTDLPADVKSEIDNILSSPDVVKVLDLSKNVDLNSTQDDTTEVDTQSVDDTVRVARTNPTNVNPNFVRKLLNHSSKDNLSPQDIKLLESASKIAQAVNNHAGRQVEISAGNQVTLSQNGNPAQSSDKLNLDEVSRSIQVDGFTDASGNQLRSVNDFAADIFTALQSDSKEFVNRDNVAVPASSIISQFNKFVQHLDNKVEAFNKSFDSFDGSKVQSFGFDSLVGGRKIVKAGSNGAAAPVFHDPNSPKSIEVASKTYSDALVAAEVYSVLLETFPEEFTGFSPIQITELKTTQNQQETNNSEGVEFANNIANQIKELLPEISSNLNINVVPVGDAQAGTINSEGTLSITPETSIADITHEFRNILNSTVVGTDLRDAITTVESTKEGQERLRKYLNESKDSGIIPSDVNLSNQAEISNGLIAAFLADPASVESVVPEIFNTLSNSRLSEFSFLNETSTDQNTTVAQEQSEIDNSSEVQESTETQENTTAVEAEVNTSETIVDEVQTSDEQLNENTEIDIFENTHESFGKTFIKNEGNSNFNGVQDTIDKIKSEDSSGDFIKVFNRLKEVVGDEVQKSISTIKMSKKDNRTVIEGISDNQSLLNNPRFVSLSMLDNNSGEFNTEILDAALLSFSNWITTARNSPTKSFEDILSEDLNVTIEDVSSRINNESEAEKGITKDSILYGMDKSTIVKEVTNLTLSVLDIRKNPESTIVQYNGMMEGLIDTIIDTATEHMTGFQYGSVPIGIETSQGSKSIVDRKVILFNTLKEVQASISKESKGVLSKLNNEVDRSFPSIGNKITNTIETQKRTNLKLSTKELAAVRTMEDTPYTIAPGALKLLRGLGKDALFSSLGWESIGDLDPSHPLALSISGKNEGIERDYQEALQVVEAIEATQDNTTPAYFPIEVSKVSRHQQLGINPQGNKILRLLVTPTHSKLDLNNQNHIDALWVVVAQASGIYKVEKSSREDILENIETKFQEEFGEAVSEVRRWNKEGGDLNSSLLPNSLDTQQLSSIQTVADLLDAQESGASELDTTISFELDGITNGTANMMVNHGQGLISAGQFENFARVGLFLGDSTKTLNDYYTGTDKNGAPNQDIYEVTSGNAQDYLYNDDFKGPRADALIRILGVFGDFKVLEDGSVEMTRNTAKNPTTKTVYKSGVKGIGDGIADDVLLEIYRGLLSSDQIVYPNTLNFSMKQDLETVFNTKIPDNIDKNNFRFPKDKVEDFKSFVTSSVGKSLLDAANDVIGSDIQAVNDVIVLYTQVQADYLQKLFESKLDDLIETKKAAGEIKSKNELTQAEYNKIIKEVRDLGVVFSNGEQNLSIGAVTESNAPKEGGTKFQLSSNLRDEARQESKLQRPTEASVQAIPYLTIGRGDGMTINNVASNPEGPKNSIFIFDGIDFSVLDYDQHSPAVNQGVWDSWGNNTLQDVLDAINKFTETADPVLINESFDKIRNNKYNSKNVNYTQNSVKSFGDVHYLLEDFVLKNQARKNVFKRIPVAVHQMGGSLNTFNQDGGTGETTVSYSEINREIYNEYTKLSEDRKIPLPANRAAQKIDKPIKKESPKKKEEESQNTTEVVEAKTYSAKTVLNGIKNSTSDSDTRDVIKAIEGEIDTDLKIVLGSVQVLNKYRQDNFPDDGQIINGQGVYDTANKVVYIQGDKLLKSNIETIIHELIHATTFDKVLSHYEGETNSSVERLESLLEEFLALDTKGNKEILNAQAEILLVSNKDDAYSKASAINEFMAWSLSNDKIKKTLKNTESSTFKSLSKKVIVLMTRIFGTPKSDIFSNVLFNVNVLTNKKYNDFLSSDGNGDGDNNDSGEVTPIAHNQTNKWIERVKNSIIKTREGNKPLSDGAVLTRYKDNAEDAISKLLVGGFNLDPYQRDTFKAIHISLAAEMRLDTQSALAIGNVYEYIVDNLTPEMFGPNDAELRYSTIMELFGASKNEEGVSDSIAILLALSQTSKGFRRALDQLPESEQEGIQTGSLNERLASSTGFLVRKLVGSIDTSGKNLNEVLDDLSESIIRLESEKEFTVLRGLMDRADKADNYVSGILSGVAQSTANSNRQIQDSDKSTYTKILSSSLTHITSFLDDDLGKLAAQNIKVSTHMRSKLDDLVFVREFVSEVIGTDKENSTLISLLNNSDYSVDSVRQNSRERLPAILQKAFSVAPDAAQWKSLFSVLGKNDFSVLFDIKDPDSSIKLLSDPKTLQTRIDTLEKTINSSFSNKVAKDVLDKSAQLAAYLKGNPAGNQLLRNAYAINKIAGKDTTDATQDIDQLVSLYAIRETNQEELQTIVDLYEQDPVAVNNLNTYLQGLNREEDIKEISESARLNGYKGYIPNHPSRGARLVIEKSSKAAELERLGFKDVGEYPSLPGHRYYFTNVKQGGAYSQGALKNVHNSYRGVDSTSGLTITSEVSGIVTGESADVLTDRFNKSKSVGNVDSLIPVYDDDGIIAHYERSIDPEIAQRYLNPEENLALMIGSWEGRQIEEKLAHQYNTQIIDELKKVYDNREKGTDDLYIDLIENNKLNKEYNKSAKSSNRRPDAIYADTWDVIPSHTKKYIQEVFGSKFPVRKDHVNIALGYRDPSILDIWTGKTRIPTNIQNTIKAAVKTLPGDKAISLLSGAEEGIQGAVSTAKDLIVVRSLVVPYMNAQANILHLATKGVGLKDIVRGGKEKLAEIEQFNDNVNKLFELDIKVSLAADDKNRVAILEGQIQTIKDQNKRMSIAPLIEAGAYKHISEGITDLDVEITSGRLGQWVESQVDKLPGKAQTIAKYGLLSKDTAIYRGANKSVQYGDFIAKAILYDDYVNRKNINPDKALELINEEFVNFSVLPGRVRSTIDSTGIGWFLTFKIRILKIAASTLRNNPVRALINANTVGDLGSAVNDNLASVIAQDRLEFSLGWDMLFGSANLNPWLQLTEWFKK